jgi:biotin transport system substrate-specific component
MSDPTVDPQGTASAAATSVVAPAAASASARAAVPASRASSRTRYLVVSALIAALMAAAAWISIPIGAVPVTLQVFVVVLAALLLPAGWATGALAIYLLLGAIGVPVFASGHAGLGVIAGPTGGFLTGFMIGAGLGALGRQTMEALKAPQIAADIACAATVIFVIYACGWAQLALVAHLSAGKAFLVGVVPFVGIDAIKAAVAILVANGVRRAGVLG